MDQAIMIILGAYVAGTIIGYIIHLIEFNLFDKEND
jgi:hypothetical protein